MKARALRPSASKVCIYCETEKPAADFHSHRYTTRTGRESVRLNSGCRECHNRRVKDGKRSNRDRVRERQREYRRKNADKIRERNLAYRRANPRRHAGDNLKYKYGLTVEQYESMVVAQGGVCAACGRPPSGSTKKLRVDHNHKTGKVRDLLCHNCNVSLGLLGEDIQIIRSLILYLWRHGG